MIEVYDLSAEEAIEVWQNIRGECAAWGEYREFANKSLKYWIEESLKDAVERKIGVGWYVRSDGRTGYRNGYYERLLVTPYGSVKVRVPRVREGGYEHELFERRQLFTAEVGKLIMEVYLAGVSTRRVGEVLSRTLGYEVSAGTVSEICHGLDALVRQFWNREIGDEWRYLVLDGIVLKNRSAIGVEKRVILVVMGVGIDGRKEILAFKQVESESEVGWESILNDLWNRGLKGTNLEMITTDGNKGVIAAIETVWPSVRRQRCWVHKLRNIAAKVKKRNEKECLRGLKLIYLSKNRKEAIARYKEWESRWKAEEPKAVACMRVDLEDMLSVFDLPEEDRVMMRTTNGIERVFREVRRRTRTISCFTNRRSIDRMIYALLTRQNRVWKEGCLPNFTHSA